MKKSCALLVFSVCVIFGASASLVASDFDADPIDLGSDTSSTQQSGIGSIS